MTTIPTEPDRRIPRPAYLQQAMQAFTKAEISSDDPRRLFSQATRETIISWKAPARRLSPMANRASHGLPLILFMAR